MRSLTCDQVFERLTRAPFPANGSEFESPSEHTVGEENAAEAAVEAHLHICHDCRCLAEALRPAVDLLNETIVGEERRTLPAYQGELAVILQRPTDYDTGIKTADKVVVSRDVASARTRRGSFGILLGLIPAVGLAVLLMVAAAGSRRPTMTSTATPMVSDSAACGLAGLQLADDCLPELELVAFSQVAQSTAEVASHECGSCHTSFNHKSLHNACCTNCHAVGAEKAPKLPNMTALLSSCSRCHL